MPTDTPSFPPLGNCDVTAHKITSHPHYGYCKNWKPLAPLPPPQARTPLIEAAKLADWGQIVANGGPPCFQVLDGKFCLRTLAWPGHTNTPEDWPQHKFVSLADLLAESAPQEAGARELAGRICCMLGEKHGVNFPYASTARKHPWEDDIAELLAASERGVPLEEKK